jgi:hypothetical protein
MVGTTISIGEITWNARASLSQPIWLLALAAHAMAGQADRAAICDRALAGGEDIFCRISDAPPNELPDLDILM